MSSKDDKIRIIVLIIIFVQSQGLPQSKEIKLSISSTELKDSEAGGCRKLVATKSVLYISDENSPLVCLPVDHYSPHVAVF